MGAHAMAQGQVSSIIAEKRRFAAFISYSHADSAVAAKLQRKLERYRLPKHIVAAQALDNAGLGQIFRDREDLAAAASLSDAIRAAIADAETLIVICSPDAKASQWVSAEIDLFRELHPDKPVLAALVRGEPAEAFPAALTEGGREPLAADLRPGGDGGSLGFLKIVAGIACVPLDTLVQRDAQRRVRRVMWITGAALAAMLIMGIMTTLALQARNEAARQRASAEGLVEYMLTDLRDILKGVGRPEAMSSVNERALKHYQEEGSLDNLPADSLDRRARILLAMGEDDERYGRLDQAIEKFREAHRTTAALLAQEPKNPDRIFAHGQSEYWVGWAALQKKDFEETESFWRGYLDQAKSLSIEEPGTVRSFMEMGYAYGNLCELNLKRERNFDAAEQQCLNAVKFEKQAYETSGKTNKIAQDLANREGWLADAYSKNGKLNAAIDARQNEKALLDRLLKDDPKNVEYGLRRGWADIGLASYYFDLGQPERAQQILLPYLASSIFKMPDTEKRVAETKYRIAFGLSRVADELDQNPSRFLQITNQLDRTMPSIHKDWRDRSAKIRQKLFANRRKVK
jgi:hypothetical protein